MSDIRRVAEEIHDALDTDYGYYHDREQGTVVITSDKLARALLKSGWLSPDQRFEEENQRRELMRKEFQRLQSIEGKIASNAFNQLKRRWRRSQNT
jgi:hypothetical protein